MEVQHSRIKIHAQAQAQAPAPEGICIYFLKLSVCLQYLMYYAKLDPERAYFTQT